MCSSVGIDVEIYHLESLSARDANFQELLCLSQGRIYRLRPLLTGRILLTEVAFIPDEFPARKGFRHLSRCVWALVMVVVFLLV